MTFKGTVSEMRKFFTLFGHERVMEYEPETIDKTIAKIRAQARTRIVEQYGATITEIEDGKKEHITYKGVRLYPHESSTVKDNEVIFTFLFQDIARADHNKSKAKSTYPYNLMVEVSGSGEIKSSEVNW